MLVLSVILTVMLFACEKDEPGENLIPQPSDQGTLIDVIGGTITAMEGNVIISVPAGALTSPTRFMVRELISKSSRNYALKTIVIEPLVEFAMPAQLSLRYDGCLANGINVCEAKSINFSIWDNENAFMQLQTPKVCSCCEVNESSCAVCMCICQTGVIATKADL
jgi:hypothetical protein